MIIFKEWESLGLLSRRQFGTLLSAAGIAALLPQTAAAVSVTESEVIIDTPDGKCDAYFAHPSNGTAPGVLFWPDIFGLRTATRQMGKGLAEQGYSVVVVNPFYRSGKATDAPLVLPPSGPILERVKTSTATTDLTDTKAFVAWLDQRLQTRHHGSGQSAPAGGQIEGIAPHCDRRE